MTVLKESISSIENHKGKWRARLIESDVRGSSAYYPADILKRDAHLFSKGVHMYANHMSESESFERPEGDVNNLIGVLESDAVFEEDGLYADLKIFEHKKEWVKEIAPYIGLSIRAAGEVEESDEGPVLKRFSKILSVDLVTKAGAGGKFVSLTESAKPGMFEELEQPNEKEEIMEIPKELLEALDAQAQKQDALAEAVTALVAKLTESEEAEVEESAEVDPLEVAQKLNESGLSKEAAARALAAHKAGADLEEAIANEKEYVEQIAESARQETFSANLEESGKSSFSASATIFGSK